MGWVKLTFYAVLLALFAAFLHYSLPQNVVVEMTGTDLRRVDFETTDPDGNTVTRTRDVREIYSTDPDGAEWVFRNEDNWIYLKWDSADLTARAQNIAGEENHWAVVTYYGWRSNFFSWYPNALDIRRASGPGEELPYWPNVLIVSVIVITLLILRRLALITIQRFTDPIIDDLEAADDAERGFFGRLWRRLGRSLFGVRRA
ncbi:MAG: DUF1523 family protein [Pseudomonadota bacterium]